MAKVVKSDPWQAECDARTLVEHAELSSNRSRMTAAKRVLKEQAKSVDKALGVEKKSSPHRSTKKSYI